jgi:dUTP pyrophosphatase
MIHDVAFNDFITERNFAKCGVLPVKRLRVSATLPAYGSNGAAGLDLSADLSDEHYGNFTTIFDEKLGEAVEAITILPGKRRLIKTGIAVKLPAGTYGRVAPRSGLAYKHGIDVMAGVIDEDYRGDIGVILYNSGDEPFHVTHGMRIAQLIVEVYRPVLVVERDSLDVTNRGEGGFGSTGV